MFQKKIPEAIKQFHHKKSQSVQTAGLHSLNSSLASGGSIFIETEDYSTRIVVIPIGRIRQTAVERK